jgi:thymidylate synthase
MNNYSNIHEAYLGALRDVYHNYEYMSSPRGLPVREILDYSFRVTNPVAEPIVTLDPERNKAIAEYTAKEVALYNSCSNRVEDFEKASKFWKHIANADGTINSAYGFLIWANKIHGNEKFEGVYRTPWEWAKTSLIQDKDTRQAILRFSLPEHQWIGNRDQTCTMHANFLIRHDKLHLSVVMRSNDLMKGLVYDLSWFVSLMDRMVEELKPTYPDLVKGSYTHTVHSMHLYEKDAPAILKMMGQS